MVTPENMHENAMFKPMVKTAKRNGVKASWVASDAIHDSRETGSYVKSIEARAFIDCNSKKGGKDKVRRSWALRGFMPVSIHVHIVFIATLNVAADGDGLDEKKMHQNDLLEERVILSNYKTHDNNGFTLRKENNLTKSEDDSNFIWIYGIMYSSGQPQSFLVKFRKYLKLANDMSGGTP
jgi:hypothetical protein